MKKILKLDIENRINKENRKIEEILEIKNLQIEEEMETTVKENVKSKKKVPTLNIQKMWDTIR